MLLQIWYDSIEHNVKRLRSVDNVIQINLIYGHILHLKLNAMNAEEKYSNIFVAAVYTYLHPQTWQTYEPTEQGRSDR